jgi:hypothetical protein
VLSVLAAGNKPAEAAHAARAQSERPAGRASRLREAKRPEAAPGV